MNAVCEVSVRFHVNSKGEAKACSARIGNCPFGEEEDHRNSAAAARLSYEEGKRTFESPKKLKKPIRTFSQAEGNYHGELPPRSIQVNALNETQQALDNEGKTQLIAACGTGKSYMGQQLAANAMNEFDSSGITIVLVPSVKLAQDTASDYKKAHPEWIVIAVHNQSEDVLDEIKAGSAVMSPGKLKEHWDNSLEMRRKTVIVSTYKSMGMVQKVQGELGEKASADLLINDEAHNILGQQKSSSKRKSKEGEELTEEDMLNVSYTSFHNGLPGAIQASKRLYMTATPVLPDSPDSDSSHATGSNMEESLAKLQAQAKVMESSYQARMTVYSDDELIVGRVSGFIAQEAAIGAGSLTTPDYQLRSARVGQGVENPSDFVDIHGNLHTGSFSSARPPMTAQTYAAALATLNAFVEEPQSRADGALKSPSHNAIIYTDEIKQAEALQRELKNLALIQSEGFTLSEARLNANSDDPELRRQARMRLIAEHMEVASAHSKHTEKQLQQTFGMFKDSVYGKDGNTDWTPHKKVLANVDILSEGVSISEIDTVVIATPYKTSERTMTQAIGRALRTSSESTLKNTGHVIIPRIEREDGKELNGALVTAATYGATRVERAVTPRQLRKEDVPPDTKTTFHYYDSRGTKMDSRLASAIAKDHVSSMEEFVGAQGMELAHQYFTSSNAKMSEEKRAAIDSYRSLSSEAEKLEMEYAYILDRSESNAGDHWDVAASVLRGKSPGELAAIRQNGRVVTQALISNDFTAIPESMISPLVRSNIVSKRGKRVDDLSENKKKEFLSRYATPIALTFASKSVESTFPELSRYIGEGVNFTNASKFAGGAHSDSSDYDKLMANFRKISESPRGQEILFESVGEALEVAPTKSHQSSEVKAQAKVKEKFKELLSNRAGHEKNPKTGERMNIAADLRSARTEAKESAVAAVASGVAEYQLSTGAMTKKGYITSARLKSMAENIS